MYVMTRVLKMKWLAVVFAIGTLFMALSAGALLQANSIADVLREGYRINPWWVGLLVAVFTGVVTVGGVKRIAAYSEWLVAIMGGVYLLISLAVVLIHLPQLPQAVWGHPLRAFTGKAAAGGALGTAVYAVFMAAVRAIGCGVSRSVMCTRSRPGKRGHSGLCGQNARSGAHGHYFGHLGILDGVYLPAVRPGGRTGRRLAQS